MSLSETIDTDPVNPPRLYGKPLGSARFKSSPQDFQVEEVLGFEPSGEGEHCFVWVEKLGCNTNDVASEFATRLGIRKRLVSHSGLKDKAAVTRQWFSLHLPGKESPSVSQLEFEGVRVLKITRNRRKLQRGVHDGNRFRIVLRNCTFSRNDVTDRWQRIVQRGVPNYFGSQRFGHHGGNMEQARRFLSGETPIRDRLLRGILISAVRSYIFNACVAERVRREIWETAIDGEVFGFSNNRSLVLPENLHGDESDRVRDGRLELTAPLWGKGSPLSRTDVNEMETNVVANMPDLIDGLAQFNLRQERRVIRLTPLSPELHWESDTTLVLQFELPTGTYATTVLRELAELLV